MALRKYRVGYRSYGENKNYYMVNWHQDREDKMWIYASVEKPEEAQKFKRPIDCVRLIESFAKDVQGRFFFEPCT